MNGGLWLFKGGLWLLKGGRWLLNGGCWLFKGGRWLLKGGLWLLNGGLWLLKVGLIWFPSGTGGRAKGRPAGGRGGRPWGLGGPSSPPKEIWPNARGRRWRRRRCHQSSMVGVVRGEVVGGEVPLYPGSPGGQGFPRTWETLSLATLLYFALIHQTLFYLIYNIMAAP